MFSARIAPLLVTACFTFMGPAIAATGERAGIELLRNYLNGLESFSAAFTQERYDEYGDLLETASGRCLVKRPGRFRWSYTSPYLQSIVGDGDTLWIYDEDLEQVTVNPMGEVKAGSPAELFGGGMDVDSRYDIEALGPDGAYDWYRLTPKLAATDFQRIDLGLAGGEVRAMRLNDNLGQLTLLHFDEISRNLELDDKLFEFSPPPGVDVIRGGVP